MTNPDVETIRAYLAALNAGDVAGVMARCTEDVELRPPNAPIEGVYVGPEGFARFLADMSDVSAGFRLEVERLDDRGAGVVVGDLCMTGRGRTTELYADVPLPTVYELVAGRIRRARVFLDRDAARAAADALSTDEARLRRVYEARDAVGAAGVAPFLADDVEVHLPRESLAAGAGPLRGRAAVLAQLEEFDEAFLEHASRPKRILPAGGGRYLVLGSQSARSATGVEVDTTLSHLWTVRDGLAVRLEIYGSPEEARRAAGLEP